MPDQENNNADGVAAAQRSSKKKELKKTVKDLQMQHLGLQEERDRLEKENEALKRRMNAQDAAANGDNTEQAAPSKADTDFWKKHAKAAGGRACALFDPFLDHKSLADHRVQTHMNEILSDVSRAKDGDDDLQDSHNPELYWKTYRFKPPGAATMSREIIFHLPKSPEKLWLEEWFQNAIGKGIRKLRSIYVYDIARCYSKIFKIQNDKFETRLQRPDLPEVQALSDFMHMEEDKCIARSLRFLLLGESAIEGQRSSKARDSHSKLWHVKLVTPSLLEFAATAIKCVLSGESSFELGVGPINWLDYFHARMRLLARFQDNHPDLFEELMDYYNKDVFPNSYTGGDVAEVENNAPGNQAQAGMSGAEQAFFQQLEG